MTTLGYLTLPKAINQDPRYQSLNSDAKILYMAFLDRFKLSLKNGKDWLDKSGKTYIVFTRSEMCRLLRKSEPYIRKLVRALVNCGLISEKRQGLTKPNLIYPNVLETSNRSEAKPDSAPEPTPDFVPERNSFSRNNSNTTKLNSNDHKSRIPWSKNLPKDHWWWENGQKLCWTGATQSAAMISRYMSSDEMNSLFDLI